MDPLGKPVGGDDHGAGIGVSGGYGQPNAQNTQAGMMADNEKTGFNAGVGGAHASGGLPGQSAGSTGSAHPIADQFMSGSTGTGASTGSGQGKLDNSLDNFGGNAGAAGAGAGTGGLAAAGAAGLTNTTGAAGQGDSAVSGAYEGGEAQDALTGQSRAFETSQGVCYGGENLSSTLGVGAGAGAAGAGAGAAAAAGTGHAYGTGVGAAGGAGGHYDPATAGSGKATGAGAAGAGAGAGAAAGAAGAAGAAEGTKQGHYGTTETDFDRGAPLSDPKEVDTGGPHSLVLDPATGKYIHRHEKEGGALADEQPRPE